MLNQSKVCLRHRSFLFSKFRHQPGTYIYTPVCLYRPCPHTIRIAILSPALTSQATLHSRSLCAPSAESELISCRVINISPLPVTEMYVQFLINSEENSQVAKQDSAGKRLGKFADPI